MKTITINVLLLFIGIMTTTAQTLDELINIAESNNLQLKVLENEYFAALEKAPQASQLPDFEIGLGFYPLPVETRLGAQNTRLSAAQMFPWFGTLDAKSDLEVAKATAIHKRVAISNLELSFKIKQAYFQLYEIEQSQVFIQKNITLFESLERLALTKVENGKASTADVLRVQLKTEEFKQELQILESTKISPRVTINQLLDRPFETMININEALSFAELAYNKTSLLDQIQATHPSLLQLERQQDVSKQALVVNSLNAKPSFGVGADYMMLSPRTDADPTNNGRNVLQMRVVVRIPLNQQKYHAKEREEHFKYTVLDQKKDDLFSFFGANIEKAYAAHEIAQLRTKLFIRQKKLTQATVNILQTKYSTQGSSFDELLRLEQELVSYDLKILKAIVQSHIAKSQIERFLPESK